MKEITVTVHNETGLHSRPADLFVRTAKLYASSVLVYKGEKSADAKNIIKVILLNVSQGEQIRIAAEGTDADEALADLERLIASNFETVNESIQI